LAQPLGAGILAAACLRAQEAQWVVIQRKQTGAAAAGAALAVSPAVTAIVAIAAVEVAAMTHRPGMGSRMTTASKP